MDEVQFFLCVKQGVLPFILCSTYNVFVAWNWSSDFRCSFYFFFTLMSLIISVKYSRLFQSNILFRLCVQQYFQWCLSMSMLSSCLYKTFFVFFFEVYTHSYTSWNCLQPSNHDLGRRQEKLPLPRMSTSDQGQCVKELHVFACSAARTLI